MDEIFEKVSKNVSKAAEKVEVWSQIGRKKIEIKKIESKINKAFKELGIEVYEFLDKKGFSEIKKEEVSVELSQIKSLLDEKNIIIEKINLLKADENKDKEES